MQKVPKIRAHAEILQPYLPLRQMYRNTPHRPMQEITGNPSEVHPQSR